jgi:hypothetical protein
MGTTPRSNKSASSTDVRDRLRDVLGIGSGIAADKTSAAKALAERHGLIRYNYASHDLRDHADRTEADYRRHPAAFLVMSLDERWVLRRA